MKFLITGAYGFVGTNLCKYLAGKGHVCDALDIPAAKREGVPYAHTYSWDDVGPCRGGEVEKGNFNLSDYDSVVHLAGKAHDLKKVASEQSYFDVNVGLTQRIFNAIRAAVEPCRGVEVEKKRTVFVYFSSCKSVEQDTPYAKSKWAAEQWLREKSSVDGEGLATIILRPAPIHGPGNKGNLNLLWSVVKHGIPWPLAAFENRRPFTSIGNVCAVVEALASRLHQPSAASCSDPCQSALIRGSTLSTFFLCDDDFVSTNRIIELMAHARGAHARLWRVPKGLMKVAARVGDVLHLPLNTERIEKLTEDYFVDNSELKKVLGWEKFPVFVEDGMLETFKSFL